MDCIYCSRELPPESAFCAYCGKNQTKKPNKHIKRPNGTGTVYKLSGRRRRPWVAAKNSVVIGYYEKKTEAQKAVNAFAKKPVTSRYNMTFSEVYEEWKLEHFRDLTQKGTDGYETAYKHLAALHGSKFRDLRTNHYQSEIDNFVRKGRSHSAANKIKQLVGQMSKWAMRNEIINLNYAQFIKLPENKTKEKEVFTTIDIEKLKADTGDAAKIVLMLIYTGMRIGELFSLPCSAVHDGYCIGGEKTDAGKNRVIPIPSDVRPFFLILKQEPAMIRF